MHLAKLAWLLTFTAIADFFFLNVLMKERVPNIPFGFRKIYVWLKTLTLSFRYSDTSMRLSRFSSRRRRSSKFFFMISFTSSICLDRSLVLSFICCPSPFPSISCDGGQRDSRQLKLRLWKSLLLLLWQRQITACSDSLKKLDFLFSCHHL